MKSTKDILDYATEKYMQADHGSISEQFYHFVSVAAFAGLPMDKMVEEIEKDRRQVEDALECMKTFLAFVKPC